MVNVSAQAQEVGKLKLDDGSRADDTGPAGEFPDLRQPRRRSALHHVNGGELVQGANTPDFPCPVISDPQGLLEGQARCAQVARPLPAPDHIERLQRDLGGPSGKPRIRRRRERTTSQHLGVIELARRKRVARRHCIGPARQLPVGQLLCDSRRGGQVGSRRSGMVFGSGPGSEQPDQGRAAEVVASILEPADQALSERSKPVVVPGRRQRVREFLVDLDAEHRLGRSRFRQQCAGVLERRDRTADGAMPQRAATRP